MRRVISILFLLLMLLQAIPVLYFFSSQKNVSYAYVDEEKPDNKSKEKKEGKEFLCLPVSFPVEQTIKAHFSAVPESYYASPLLELLTPPPDAC